MLESCSMRSKLFKLIKGAGLCCSLLAVIACAPEKTPTPAPSVSSGRTGTLTVDADISKGTRFRVYVNDQWTTPEIQPVLAGQRTKYSFHLPATLRTLRLDPGEMPDTHTVIYSIVIALPDQPRKSLPLADLPAFIKYHCNIRASGTTADITASGTEMYFMANVTPATYPVAP